MRMISDGGDVSHDGDVGDASAELVEDRNGHLPQALENRPTSSIPVDGQDSIVLYLDMSDILCVAMSHLS